MKSRKRFVELLLGNFGQKVGIDCKDKRGKTPLCIAIEYGNRDGVLLLLRKGADIMACENARQILQSCSTLVLKDILDYCVDSNDEPVDSKQLEVKLRYRTIKGMLFLADVPHHKDIVRHPVFSIFLSLTWKKTVRKYIFGAVLYYVLFLIFLTAYILYSESADTPSHKSISNNTNDLFSVNDSRMTSVNDSRMTSGMNNKKWDIISQVLWYILMILWVLSIWIWLGELTLNRRRCIKSMENWLKLVLFIVTIISLFVTVDNSEVNRDLFAIAILLGWLEFVLLLGRLPELSVQTEMLKTVSLTFLKYFVGYMFLILAFAFSFYILFKEDAKGNDVVLFKNPFISILKTIVMFSGEFYSPELPFDRSPGISHLIFLLFVFLIAIVLLNLLNGLAVGDTERVREEAKTLSLVARARMTSKLLREFNDKSSWYKRISPRYDLTKEMFVLYPNTSNQLESSDLESLRKMITKKREMSKKVKSVENVENKSWSEKELSELRLEFREMREILIEILNKKAIDLTNNGVYYHYRQSN
jgi:hypothetical protein